MELMIAEKVKKYRKERDMRQEALAQALGVASQSVSKWECGEGYPDITLLPAIANFFEVTVDELIGNDEISAKEDINENYFGVIHKRMPPPEEMLELSLKYYRKYPRDWNIATKLMHEITRRHREKLDEYKPLLNEICERVLKNCTDSELRCRAVMSMCMICEEDEVRAWLDKDSKMWNDERRLEVWEERYKLLGDIEQHRIYRYAGNFLRAAHLVDRLGKLSDEYKDDVIRRKEWLEYYLGVLDGMSARKAEKEILDGWIGEYNYAYIRLAAAYFEMNEPENGYKYLERSLELHERWNKIPDHAALALGNPYAFGETKLMKDTLYIGMPNGKHMPIWHGIRSWMPHLVNQIENWSSFNSIRNEERYQTILARAKELSET